MAIILSLIEYITQHPFQFFCLTISVCLFSYLFYTLGLTQGEMNGANTCMQIILRKL